MIVRTFLTLIFAVSATFGAPAMAETLQTVTSKSQFVNLVSGRELSRFGIRLSVSPGGSIKGRAFGQPVTGAWTWKGNYFCRDLTYGATTLPTNCQLVQVGGGTIRFTSDQGAGESADLRLR
ncbi:dihydrodipicolinate reductase [Oceaniglobus ichthyenteri]|uniref:dihydrodipicolinate reductase n=1 Tax=Oceaniglobus ichthyenteri TaxID=2136177 RepID=UPI001F0B8DAF|nr:dihydrodipicolinate reductase [Oceaniglobus ichthyenteri]